MPRLTTTARTQPATKVKFVFSPALDMLNAMYFTHIAGQAEGVDGWPVELRSKMAPDLLAELDALYSYPAGEPGLMGQFGDHLWAHPETWPSVEAAIGYVQNLPDGLGDGEANPGIQGLIVNVAMNAYKDPGERHVPAEGAREALLAALMEAGVETEAALALFDRPEELRERMVRLIERFYAAHYAAELPRRRSALERSAAAHQGATADGIEALARKLTGREQSCLEIWCEGTWENLHFAPSLDMGVYNSCAIIGGRHPTHGLIYPCEPEFIGESAPDTAETQRMARIYKALGDEQRLRILHMLREREMYLQEIADSAGIHQSVASRHVTFLKAVGLVRVRKQNNMKFFSLNPEVANDLSRTIELFTGRSA
jgi:ArsR family transcriptional regulator